MGITKDTWVWDDPPMNDFRSEKLPATGMIGKTMPREKVLWWVQERLDNCHAIAAGKKGADRDGWLEDAEYFAAVLNWLTKPT